MNSRKKKTALLLLMLLLAIRVPQATAQPDSEDSGEEPATDAVASDINADREAQDSADSEEAESTEQTAVISDDDTFVPTVQISEDLSVSFPVDI